MTNTHTNNNGRRAHDAAPSGMPGSCWGRYARIGVLEVNADVERVAMISERCRAVRNVVATWERLNVGTTERCAYRRALAEAEHLAAKLNKEVKS